MKFYYKAHLKELARKLRKNSTLSEVLLWQQLKNKQVSGYDFHRQKPIDNYIVDFYCPDLDLVIEIDGRSHDLKPEQDLERQARLEALGLHVLRFLDSEIKKAPDGIASAIEQWIKMHH